MTEAQLDKRAAFREKQAYRWGWWSRVSPALWLPL